MIKLKLSPRAKNILEWFYCVIIAVILALLFRHYVGTPTIVKQPSMFPTLHPNERLILNKWVKTVNGDIKAGDIITFEAPTNNNIADVDLNNPVARYDNEPTGWWHKFTYYFLEINKTSYIKRVIGVEGDHVVIKDGKVYVNDIEQEESYLQDNVVTTSLGGAYTDIVVPKDCVFVMGDNRPHSTDSREFGCIPLEKVESKVSIRFWPLKSFRKVN